MREYTRGSLITEEGHRMLLLQDAFTKYISSVRLAIIAKNIKITGRSVRLVNETTSRHRAIDVFYTENYV